MTAPCPDVVSGEARGVAPLGGLRVRIDGEGVSAVAWVYDWHGLIVQGRPQLTQFSQLAAARAALDARGQRTAVDCSDCSHPISGHDVDDGSCRYCNCPEARP